MGTSLLNKLNTNLLFIWLFVGSGYLGWRFYPIHPDEINQYLYLQKWSVGGDVGHYLSLCHEGGFTEVPALLSILGSILFPLVDLVHTFGVRESIAIISLLFFTQLQRFYTSNALVFALAMIFLTPASLIFYVSRPEIFLIIFIGLLLHSQSQARTRILSLAFPVMCALHAKAIFFAPLLILKSIPDRLSLFTSLLMVLFGLVVGLVSSSYHSDCAEIPAIKSMFESFFINPLLLFSDPGQYLTRLILPSGFFERFFDQITFGLPSDLGHLPVLPNIDEQLSIVAIVACIGSVCILLASVYKNRHACRSFVYSSTHYEVAATVFCVLFLIVHDRTLNFYNVYLYFVVYCLCIARLSEGLDTNAKFNDHRNRPHSC